MLKINNLDVDSLSGYLEDMSLPYDVEELKRRYECLVGRRRGVFDGFKGSGADGYGADGDFYGLEALASLAAMEYGKRRGRR